MPPIVMVATRWDWGLPFMLTNFGWKAVLGILAANTIYYLRFRRELAELRPKPGKGESERPKSDHCRPSPFYRLGGPCGTLSASCRSRFFVFPRLC